MTRFFLLLLALLLPWLAFAQCMLIESTLQERVQHSQFVVEGRVVQSVSFWGPGNALIYTAHRVEVFKVFKGNDTPEIIEVITEGGIVGNRKHVASPSLELHEGDMGIFLLVPSDILNSPDTLPGQYRYRAAYGPQGFLKYRLEEDEALDPFYQFTGIQTGLHPLLVQYSGQDVLDVAPFNPQFPTPGQGPETTPNITGFAPDSITAGTFDTLTISGSGFGSTFSGMARVEFKNSDNGGSNYIITPASHILSWSDTEIKVWVPTRAGSGTIRVTSSAGNNHTSASQLVIIYNLTNLVFNGLHYRPKIANVDNAGGLTFLLNTSFSNNSAAVDAFLRGLETWRCNTFVNLKSIGTSSVSCQGDDGTNVITFDAGCPLSGGVLATAYTYYSGCGNPPNVFWVLDGADIKFRSNPAGGWNFGPGPTGGGNIDFESVAVHELGHVHQLGHIIAPGKVMHFSLSANTDIRMLDGTGDIAGGDDVVSHSIIANGCGPGAMALLNSTNCVVTTPVAAFGASPLTGCAPLTVQFTDSSFNNPTSWQWDIDNNGTIDYTSQNPMHTYSAAGTYTVKLIVSNSNASDTLLKSGLINVVEAPVADAGLAVSLCQGNTITIGGDPTASGGAGPYTYAWLPNTGLSHPGVANPIAGPGNTTTYTVTVTDANGCTGTSSITLTIHLLPNVNAGSASAICAGDSILVGGTPTASGGNGPYSYNWLPVSGLDNTATANPTASPVLTTPYTVTVTDANGCSASATTTVTVNPLPVANAGTSSSLCLGDTTLIGGSPSASGGTGPYTYTWTPALGLNDTTTPNPTASPSGGTTYTLLVSDANGCMDIDSTTIGVNPVPTADAGPAKQLCMGGSVSLGGNPTATGGTGPYTYVWQPIAGLNNLASPNPTASPIATTTYTLTITDANGCTSSGQVIVTVNALPQVSAGSNKSMCPSTSIVIGGAPTASGGTFPYTYAWSPVAALNNPLAANPIASPSNSTVYQVIVTDAAGCTGSSSTTVTVHPSPIAHAGSPATVCSGDSAILGGTPAVTGGTAPYQYQWSPATGIDLPQASNPKAAPVTHTTYTLTVSDQNGCVASASASVSVNPLPLASAGAGTAFCSGGQAIIGGSPTASGGTGPYTYTWAPSAGLNTFTAANLIASPLANTVYTVTVSDANGCSVSSSTTLVVYPLPVANAGSDATFCAGASISIGGNPSASGGTIPYMYNWTPGTGLSNTTSPNPIASPGQATTYILTVSDANACQSNDTVLVTPSGSLTIQAGNDTALCMGASTQLGGLPTANGGISPFTYSWTPTTGLNISTVANPIASPGTTTTYTVQASDSLGCLGSGTVTVTVLPLPVADAGASVTICEGNSVQLNATGGIGYTWLPVAGLSNAAISNPIASPASTTSYTVMITDQNGCSAYDSVAVTVHQNPVAHAGSTDTICFGANAFIGGTPAATGGSGTYSFYWSPPGGLNDTSIANPSASPTAPVTYTLKVTDANGCTAAASVTVAVMPTPAAIAGSDTAICEGYSVTLGGSPAASGGTPGYTYHWIPAPLGLPTANPVATPENTTSYTLIVADANGCRDTSVTTVEVLPLPAKPTITVQNDSLVSTPELSYQWYRDGQAIPGAESRAMKPETTGYYQVRVMNSLDCTSISDSFFYQVTGISRDTGTVTFAIFPNPGNGLFYLDISVPGFEGVATVEVFDFTGRRIRQLEIVIAQGTYSLLDLSAHAQGPYQVVLNAGSHQVVKQVFVVR